MNMVVYINNDMIQIVQAQHDGKFNIKSQIAVELEKGSVINGTILNKDEVISKLVELKTKVKKPILLIDSSSILLKRLDIPQMHKKQAKEILNYEIGINDVDEEYVYDLNFFDDKNQSSVIGVAVAKSIIETYIDVFKKAGIKLKKIDVLSNSVSKFIAFQKELEKDTFLFNVIAGDNMISFLFDNGNYKLLNRNKLMFESDSDEYIEELFSKISSMLQFHKSQKSEFPITVSYYVGLGKDNTKKLDKYVLLYESGIDIREMVLPSNKLSGTDGSLFYALTGIFETKKDINLISAYKEIENPSKISKSAIIKTIIPAVLCALIFVSYNFMLIDKKKLEEEIDIMSEFVSNSNNIQRVSDYEQYIVLKQKFDDILSEIDSSKQSLVIAKILNEESVNKVFEKAKNNIIIDSITYSSEEKAILITGSSKNVLECSQFVSNLYKTEIFDTINYKGYSHEEIEKSEVALFEDDYIVSEDRYRFTAKASLKEGVLIG